MATVVVNKTVDQRNHIRYDYEVDNIFLNFPNQQKYLTFVNGTASERTIPAGTLVGVTTADVTIGKELVAAATDGSQFPKGFLLYDTVIPAGAAEEVEALVGTGDDKSSIFEDKIVLNGAETLDTVITDLGITIKSAIVAYTVMKIEPTAQNITDYKDAQV